MNEQQKQPTTQPQPQSQQAQTKSDFEKLLEKKTMEFVPFGANDKIKLTPKLIQDLIAVKTKTGKTCTENDAIRFMMMCQAKRLNPFEGDAYLIGYDTNDGPKFSLITAHQAFLKRAEIHPEYDGMRSGLILLNEDGTTTSDIEGDFYLPSQTIVGGWATVHFKNRKVATTRRVRLERFNKGYGVWKDDAAGMIVKVAEADALRSSFPTMIGGLYSEGEMAFPMQATTSVDPSKLVSVVPKAQPESETQPQTEPSTQIPEASQSDHTAQDQLADIVLKAGYKWEHLAKWGQESGNISDADSLSGFGDVPTKVAKRLILAKAGLLIGLEQAKGAA